MNERAHSWVILNDKKPANLSAAGTKNTNKVH